MCYTGRRVSQIQHSSSMPLAQARGEQLLFTGVTLSDNDHSHHTVTGASDKR